MLVNWLMGKYAGNALEAPDNSSGSSIVVLVSAGIMTVQIIPLQSPGEVLERKFVVRAAAHVDRGWVIDEAH